MLFRVGNSVRAAEILVSGNFLVFEVFNLNSLVLKLLNLTKKTAFAGLDCLQVVNQVAALSLEAFIFLHAVVEEGLELVIFSPDVFKLSSVNFLDVVKLVALFFVTGGKLKFLFSFNFLNPDLELVNVINDALFPAHKGLVLLGLVKVFFLEGQDVSLLLFN